MRGWHRPYSLDVATGFAVLGLVAAAPVITFLVIVYLHGWMPAPSAILFGVWLAGGLAATARQAMLGVYVSDHGLRSRSLLRTTTVPWASVADIRSGTASVAGLDMGRVAIIIERTDGVRIQTPLQRGDLFRPFTFRPELGRLATWPEHYDEILATLRAHHRDAQRHRQVPATGRLAQPSAADSRPASPPAGGSRMRVARDAAPADKRRDLHVLTRQHQRGELTDAEFAAALAKIQGEPTRQGRDRR
ncbi:PH domain-containing protein [Micromonospora sp. NPDC048930]|uniref:PH domain-containing protein n=1 Tax=Micromonospora sp. NPDC048930 TaxID=3364261 RepID=UPI0037139D3D